MKTASLLPFLFLAPTFAHTESIPNVLIDYPSFQKTVNSKYSEREPRRLTEMEFIIAMESKEYILLDVRSTKNYKLRHIKGALNLPFTEFTEESLKSIIPNKSSKILVYCNNNFLGSPIAFASKLPAASLHLSTQVTLSIYGYSNVFELGPLLDISKTKIPFQGTETED